MVRVKSFAAAMGGWHQVALVALRNHLYPRAERANRRLAAAMLYCPCLFL